MKINLVTLCSGIEAQGQALRRLCRDYPDMEWELLAWSEINKDAIKAHNAIFPEYADRNLGDMTTADYSKITQPVDCLFYSTPCQSVSVAGQNKGMKEGSDAASALIWHTRRAIETLKPNVCILENVKGMIMGKNVKDFHKWQHVMESYGYTNFAKVLDSSQYGVPQHRERLFMISILDCTQSYHFPKPFKLEKRIKDILEPYGTVDESFYFKPEQLLRIIAHCDRKVEEGCGFKTQFHTDDEVSGCVTAKYGQRETDPCIKERTDRIIKLGNYTPNGTHAGTLCSVEGIAPTVMGQHGTVTGIVEPIMIQRGALYSNNAQAGRVYDVDGIAPCLDTCCGGNRMPKILEPIAVAMGGRNPDNPSDRTKGAPTEQRLEFGDSIANCITTVHKDSMVAEPMVSDDPRKVFGEFRYSDICPTLLDSDYKSPKIVREPIELSFDNLPDNAVLKDEDSKGYLWQDGSLWRVRKLHPIETSRLMDVADEDFYKMQDAGISKSALYGLFGNSIVVNVLYHVFRKLWIDTGNESAQKSLFDF